MGVETYGYCPYLPFLNGEGHNFYAVSSWTYYAVLPFLPSAYPLPSFYPYSAQTRAFTVLLLLDNHQFSVHSCWVPRSVLNVVHCCFRALRCGSVSNMLAAAMSHTFGTWRGHTPFQFYLFRADPVTPSAIFLCLPLFAPDSVLLYALRVFHLQDAAKEQKFWFLYS